MCEVRTGLALRIAVEVSGPPTIISRLEIARESISDRLDCRSR
jgi:hypothetical protein